MSPYPKWDILPQQINKNIITTLLIVHGVAFIAASTEQTINILMFYERLDSVKGFDAAVEYVRNSPSLGFKVGEVSKVLSNGTDITKLIRNLCRDIDEAFAKNAEQRPDVVVDFTRSGVSSEAVKQLTKTMTLPTISGSFVAPTNNGSWKDLTDEQKNYLIQIAQPADMVPQAVRSLVSQQNMTDAAFLFDEEYEMSYKNKSLLQNLTTKYLFEDLERSSHSIRNQVVHLFDQNMTNVFVAAAPMTISQVLAEGSDPDMVDGPYFSDMYNWYSLSMEPGLPKCSGCRSNVSVTHLSPKFPDGANERRAFLKSKGIFKTERFMDYFYFDLTMNAVATVAKMKKDGSWASPPRRVCSEREFAPNDYMLSLFDNLKKDDISKENLGPFHFDPDKTVGKSYAKFKMTISRLVFKPASADPSSNVDLGTWEAGLGEKELITSSGK